MQRCLIPESRSGVPWFQGCRGIESHGVAQVAACCSIPPTSLLAAQSQGEEKVNTAWKWIILPPSLQGWEGCWVQPCGPNPVPRLCVICPLLWAMAPRCAEKQHQCGKCHVEPSGRGKPEPSQVQCELKEAKLNTAELSQRELSWRNPSRAGWSRVEQPEAAGSSHMELSPASEAAVQCNKEDLSFGDLSIIVSQCLGPGEGESCLWKAMWHWLQEWLPSCLYPGSHAQLSWSVCKTLLVCRAPSLFV